MTMKSHCWHDKILKNHYETLLPTRTYAMQLTHAILNYCLFIFKNESKVNDIFWYTVKPVCSEEFMLINSFLVIFGD